MHRLRVLVVLSLVLVATAIASAQCAAPSTQGLAICFPSNGSQIMGETTFELAANTGGAAVTGVAIYDNGKKVDTLNFLPGTLVEGAIHDGSHSVTVKAWLSNGAVISANTKFTKMGFDPASCPVPTTAKVQICSPTPGGSEPNDSMPVAFSYRTAATPKSWKLYLDGVAVGSSATSTIGAVDTSIRVPAGKHKFTAKVWDTAGHVYSASQSFTAFYERDCNPKTGACTPGIVAELPDGFGPWQAVDTSLSFTVRGTVLDNHSPITSMSVLVDGVGVASTQGPGITTNVTVSHGSHNIIIEATDAAGNIYMTYGTVNAQ